MWMHAHGSRLGRKTHTQWLTGELMKLTQMVTTSLKLTGEAMIQVPTILMSSCSLKLIGELMTQVSSFFW